MSLCSFRNGSVTGGGADRIVATMATLRGDAAVGGYRARQ